MKVGYIQFAPKFGAKKQNLEKIVKLVKQAQNADLLVLPEMATTGYMVKNRKQLMELAESVPNGQTTQKLIKIARENKVFLVIGLPEEEKNKVYSTAVLVGPKGFIGKNRKTHLFLRETLYFDKGNLGFKVFNIGKVKMGIGVCFDYMFPEVWRTLALKGAQIFCLPTNLVLPYCMEVMKTRSLENGCFSISANRVGFERGQKFTGGSQIIGPRMETLAKASQREEVKVIEIDVKRANNKMVTPYNDLLKDRRPEFYKL